MKETTVHSLVMARVLLEKAEPLCESNDSYLASAGLVILQDALEMIIYALLVELEVDKHKKIEGMSFDQLVTELQNANVTFEKSGTIKALNKQRVLTKHYAQVAEPKTVRNYLVAAQQVIDVITSQVIGKTLRDLFIADLLKPGETKNHLKAAEEAISSGDYLDALIETRKAIFIEFEEAYNIYGWRDYVGQNENLILYALRGGLSAPIYKRKKEWIELHVKIPTDYVQIDYETFRLNAMEYGIHTMQLENLRRLTPAVIRIKPNAGWAVTYDAGFEESNANESNARYCLDRAVSVILKKQEHANERKDASKDKLFDPPSVYIGQSIYEAPSLSSNKLHEVSKGFVYTIHKIVGGFDPNLRFYDVSADSEETLPSESLLGGDLPVHSFRGYLQIQEEEDQ